jgi:hypothetical protein
MTSSLINAWIGLGIGAAAVAGSSSVLPARQAAAAESAASAEKTAANVPKPEKDSTRGWSLL